MGNFCIKRVIAKVGIPPFISEERIDRVLQEAGLKCDCVQRKGIVSKNGLKLRLRFTQEVRCKLSPNFWEDGGFYLDGASFTQKRNTFNENRAPEDISRSTLEKDLILVSLEKAVMKAQDGMLLFIW